MPVEDLVWAFRAGFFVLPAVAFVLTRRACIALQRRDRRRLREGTEFGIAALRDGAAYAAVARPASGEERAVMEARRPDELFMPIPRHLVPLPTPRRVLAQLRARVNHFYVLSRLETPSAGPRPGTDGQASHAGPVWLQPCPANLATVTIDRTGTALAMASGPNYLAGSNKVTVVKQHGLEPRESSFGNVPLFGAGLPALRAQRAARGHRYGGGSHPCLPGRAFSSGHRPSWAALRNCSAPHQAC